MELSKYDVMNQKMDKFSNIVASFMGAYALAFTKKKKYEVLKKHYNILIKEAHILFEIKKDVINYLRINSDDMTVLSFFENLSNTSKDLEKVLLFYLIVDEKNHDLIYQLLVDFISKKLTESELISYMCKGLDKEDQEILKFVMSDDYDFNLLPNNYKNLILQIHLYQ